MKVGKGKRTQDGYKHSVEYGEKTFQNVQNISKFMHCTSQTCKYYSECNNNGGVVRRFDCMKTLKRFLFFYYMISACLVFYLSYRIFTFPEISFFTRVGLLIMSFVILDVICSVLEYIIPVVRDKFFYKKLLKFEKQEKIREEKEKAEKEQKKAQEERELMSQSAYYQKVVRAEIYVNNLKKLMDEHDFGENSSKIMECARYLDEIVNILKNDNSYYSRVSFLFENVLIDFFDTLKLYVQMLKNGIDDAKFETIINASINKFHSYLINEVNGGVFKDDSIISQFQISAKSLSRLIDENGGNNYEN